jgi:hypothetical protein
MTGRKTDATLLRGEASRLERLTRPATVTQQDLGHFLQSREFVWQVQALYASENAAGTAHRGRNRDICWDLERRCSLRLACGLPAWTMDTLPAEVTRAS